MLIMRSDYVITHVYIQINEVRKLIGPQSGKLELFCSDASIARYLRARNWNVKKAVKMLKATLKWRSEYKPDEIRWVIYNRLTVFFYWLYANGFSTPFVKNAFELPVYLEISSELSNFCLIS